MIEDMHAKSHQHVPTARREGVLWMRGLQATPVHLGLLYDKYMCDSIFSHAHITIASDLTAKELNSKIVFTRAIA